MRGKVTCSVFVLFLFFALNVRAALNTGAVAADFNLTDINGQHHSLSEMIAQGKKVIVNFGATWSPSSWKYAYSQTLNDINTLYGEEGLNNLVVLYIESDLNTSTACIQGDENCNSSSMGDWSAMLNYPIINLTEEDAELLGIYQVDQYPTIYGINSDWTITNLGQTNHAKIMNWMFGEQSLHASVDVKNNPTLASNFFEINKLQKSVKFHGSKAAVSTKDANKTSYYSNLFSEVQNELNHDVTSSPTHSNVDNTIDVELSNALSKIQMQYLLR